MAATRAMISCRSGEAMPAVGSSSIRRWGSLARAMASSRRRWSPWARMPLGLAAWAASPTRSSRARAAIAVEPAGRAQEVVVPAVVGQERGLHVLEGAEAAEDARDLEGPAEAAPAEILRSQAAHLLAPHVDLAGVVREVTGDQVEQGGLARAVGADDGSEVAGGHGEVDAVDGLDAAEVLLEPDRAQG